MFPNTKHIESIALFGKNTLYVIDHTSGSCHTEPLNTKMEQDCVPTDATLDATITIGGSLSANVYSYNRTERGEDVHYTQVRTAIGCTPIDSFVSSRRIGVDVNYVWNVTPGIKNVTVFVPPTNCTSNFSTTTPSHPLYAQIMKVTRAIAKGKLWETSF